jgi:hypothetical protein
MLNRKKTKFDASMVLNMTHLRFYGRKIISSHFQLVRIVYKKLDFHGFSRITAVFIINNLNVLRYNSGTMNTKSLLRLSFHRSDNKFYCEVCDKYYKTALGLDRHVCRRKKTYPCTIEGCNSVLATNGSRVRHEITCRQR